MADVSETVAKTELEIAAIEKKKKYIKYAIIVIGAVALFFIVKKFVLKK